MSCYRQNLAYEVPVNQVIVHLQFTRLFEKICEEARQLRKLIFFVKECEACRVVYPVVVIDSAIHNRGNAADCFIAFQGFDKCIDPDAMHGEIEKNKIERVVLVQKQLHCFLAVEHDQDHRLIGDFCHGFGESLVIIRVIGNQ